ncbi:MAG: SRPBCC family protein [Verrucomicrobiota bacterium]
MPKFHVEKSVVIESPREVVFDHLRDFKGWPEWSPWIITDPECTITFADDGSAYSWDGPVCGAGEMKVVNEQSPKLIESRLTFLKPWKSFADVRFTLVEVDEGTEVVWSMDSELPMLMFWMKPMMVAVIGMDYERGLNMLKARLETGTVPSKLEFPGQSTFDGVTFLGVRTRCPIPDMGTNMMRDFGKLGEWMTEKEIAPAGDFLSIYHKWEPVKQIVEYTSAIPVESVPTDLPDSFLNGSIPSCDTFPIRHTGSYQHLGNAWSAGVHRSRNRIIKQSKLIHPFEVYETIPGSVPDDETITAVHFPLRG